MSRKVRGWTATWTLLVHTLRTEAIAAEETHAAQDALTPLLARTTTFATGLTIVLALVFFAALPRMKSSLVTGGGRGSQTLSGFSDVVTLGTIGRIRKDRRVVLRVETLEGEAPAPADALRGVATLDPPTELHFVDQQRLPVAVAHLAAGRDEPRGLLARRATSAAAAVPSSRPPRSCSPRAPGLPRRSRLRWSTSRPAR